MRGSTAERPANNEEEVFNLSGCIYVIVVVGSTNSAFPLLKLRVLLSPTTSARRCISGR